MLFLKALLMKGLFFIFAYMILFIGGPEIVIVVLFIVIFLAQKIPELAKGIGRAVREMQDASNEIKKEIKDSASKIKDDIEK